jgi:hypothetical protein
MSGKRTVTRSQEYSESIINTKKNMSVKLAIGLVLISVASVIESEHL